MGRELWDVQKNHYKHLVTVWRCILFQILMLLDVVNGAADDSMQGDELHSDLLSTYACLEELGSCVFPNLEPLPDVPGNAFLSFFLS